MFAIKSNIPLLEKKIDRLRKLTDKGWQQDAVNVMKAAANMLSLLTPRSKGKKESGQHLADGWTTRTIGRSGKDRVPVTTVVYNKFATDSAGRRKKRAVVGEGGSGPYTVLDILEYGSRAHVITPGRVVFGRKQGRSGARIGRKTGSSVLVFTSSTGETVFTKRVDHPGTKPYGMIRLTKARLPRIMDAMNMKWKRKIEKEWSG